MSWISITVLVSAVTAAGDASVTGLLSFMVHHETTFIAGGLSLRISSFLANFAAFPLRTLRYGGAAFSSRPFASNGLKIILYALRLEPPRRSTLEIRQRMPGRKTSPLAADHSRIPGPER